MAGKVGNTQSTFNLYMYLESYTEGTMEELSKTKNQHGLQHKKVSVVPLSI